ncbi:sirohydrochlorin chelatase [Mycobacterium manitobense]|uniref:Sirohydrochlorin chelatase n=1 Tax=[Mycobacterium] manitobense TaxID=190147 RepID=A0A9X3BYR3_9MYCO|nr:sirohydrochlorin chelatase [[Mycobacterium] manitobense]MCV7172247.1 sirohydrochlorin chelatase [[Mycobacterium] manitobense]
MRAARVVTRPNPPRPEPALILTAHGSADPRSAEVTHAVAGRIRRLRPWLDVRAAFLDHTGPRLGEVLRQTPDGVVVPFLLADAFHARTDIPAMIAESGCRAGQAAVLGEDPALLAVARQRLSEAGVSPDDERLGVLVAAVGSSSAAANARTATVPHALAVGTRWAGAEVAFATVPHNTPAQAAAALRHRGADHVVIVPWFLAPGRITDRVAGFAAREAMTMAEPLGSHNLVAATVLDRFDEVTSSAVAA